MKKINKNDILEDIKILKEKSKSVFSDVSESYRQKVVYNLLNIVRSGDMNQFLWTILRLANARKESEDTRKFISSVNKLYGYGTRFFEKWAYTIIMGIMSAETKEGGE